MMKSIGIIGAGQMGSGIAHVCALAGMDVLLHDVNEDAIESGLATISGNLARQVTSEKITDDARRKALYEGDILVGTVQLRSRVDGRRMYEYRWRWFDRGTLLTCWTAMARRPASFFR